MVQNGVCKTHSPLSTLKKGISQHRIAGMHDPYESLAGTWKPYTTKVL